MILAFGDNFTLMSNDLGKSWRIWDDGILFKFIIKKEERTDELHNIKDRQVIGTKNNGILISDDDGTTWDKTSITEGAWNQLNSEYDALNTTIPLKIYAKNRDTDEVYISTDNALNWRQVQDEMPGYIPQYISSTEINIEGLKLEDVDKVVDYILWKNIYPVVSKECTGFEEFPSLKKEAQSIYNKKPILFRTEEEAKKYYSFLTVIDWKEDVNMNKIGDLTVDDLINTEEDTNSYITEDIENITDERYLKTIDYVRSIITELKSKVILSNANDILSIKLDGREKIKNVASEEYLDNDLKAYDFYIDTTKKSCSALLSNITNYVFSFEEFSLQNIVLDAVLEATLCCAGSIKFNLIKAIKSNKTTFDPFRDATIKFNFKREIIKVLKDTMNEISLRTKTVNAEMDKNLIKIAADYYNNNLRKDFIEIADNILLDICSNFNYLIKDIEYDYCVKELDEYFNSIKEGNASIPSDDFKFKKYNFYLLRKMFITNIKKEFENKLRKKVLISFTSDFANETFGSFDSNEVYRIENYLTEIENKFISRCIELIDYNIKTYLKTNEQKLNYKIKCIIRDEENSLIAWENKLNNEGIKEKFFNDYHLPSLDKKVKEAYKDIIDSMPILFSNNKEII